MQSLKRRVLSIFLTLVAVIFVYVLYTTFMNKLAFRKYRQVVNIEKAVDANKEVKVVPSRVVSQKTGKTWLDVQKQVKDTVVQVFSQTSEFNWTEPYKTPAQGEGAGSGFFINADGDLITNYHVVA